MPTPAQIDEQIAFERTQIAQGLKKLRDNTRQLEEKEYASASIYGAASMDTLLPLVVASIEKTFSYKIKRGKNGDCLLYTSPSPRDLSTSRMPSSA